MIFILILLAMHSYLAQKIFISLRFFYKIEHIQNYEIKDSPVKSAGLNTQCTSNAVYVLKVISGN